MKATEQYFIMLYKVSLTFKSVDETLVCGHSSERYWAVVSHAGVVELLYSLSNPSAWRFKKSNWAVLSSGAGPFQLEMSPRSGTTVLSSAKLTHLCILHSWFYFGKLCHHTGLLLFDLLGLFLKQNKYNTNQYCCGWSKAAIGTHSVSTANLFSPTPTVKSLQFL